MSFRLLLNRTLREAVTQVQRLHKTEVQPALQLARVSLLKANAELLRGAMTFVERELNRAQAAPPPEAPESPPPSPKKSILIE